jgi:iron complex transport system permease protein
MKSPLRVLLLFVSVSCAVLALAPIFGANTITWNEIRNAAPTDTASVVFWKMRVPRVLMAYLVGAGLGAAGLVFQSLFRNALATPFTLGVSSGAALGAAAYFALGFSFSILGASGSTLFALGGALATVALLFVLGGVGRGLSSATLLLAGVIINFFFSSLVVFMQYVSNYGQLFRLTRWLMGTVEVVGADAVEALAPFVLGGTALAWLYWRELDLLLLGSELARSRGVNEARARLALLLIGSCIAGAIVSFCGPIGFVGIVVPWICRFLCERSHRTLLPACALCGGSMLVLCDLVARTIIAPFEIPVGVVTALLGGPFFLYVLLTRREEAIT